MRKSISVNDIHINYIEEGNGEVCVFLHGMRDSKEIWTDVISRVKDEYKCIAVDMRGHGESDKPENMNEYKLELFFDDLINIFNTLAIKSANIIAHSFGASVAIWMALNYPDRVKKLVLVGCGKGTEEDNKRRHFKPPKEIKNPKEIQEFMMPMFFPKGRKTIKDEKIEAIKKTIVSGWDKLHAEKYATANRGLSKLSRPVYENEYINLNIPALLVFGELDRIAVLENGEYLHSQIPNSKLVVMEDSGHYMFLERETEFCSILLDFLKSDVI